jgi:gluconate 5-dehydrogenase
MARWGRPEELIGAAVFLASEAASYVNGDTIHVDGGVANALSLPVAITS